MSGFASAQDLADKTVSFDELGAGLYAYTAEGDPIRASSWGRTAWSWWMRRRRPPWRRT
jgi:hypothetical protein